MHFFNYFKKTLFFLVLLSHLISEGQKDSLKNIHIAHKKRETAVYTSIGITYTTLAYGLYNAWYKNYPTTQFHFFNDNDEWLQMDKVGHAYSCNAEAIAGIQLMEYLGLSEKKSLWTGGLIGFGMQTMVEIMDGFSSKWGFSWGDMSANVVGTSITMLQHHYWKEQRIKLCYSFHKTEFSTLRPEVLGHTFLTRTLKDYNGQTAWLSLNLSSWFPKRSIPAWVNIDIGYGAYGMITGNPNENNNFVFNGNSFNYSSIVRYRKFFLSPDINLQKIPYIKKRPKLLAIAHLLSPLKVPLPALQFDKFGVKFNSFYF